MRSNSRRHSVADKCLALVAASVQTCPCCGFTPRVSWEDQLEWTTQSRGPRLSRKAGESGPSHDFFSTQMCVWGGGGRRNNIQVVRCCFSLPLTCSLLSLARYFSLAVFIAPSRSFSLARCLSPVFVSRTGYHLPSLSRFLTCCRFSARCSSLPFTRSLFFASSLSDTDSSQMLI